MTWKMSEGQLLISDRTVSRQSSCRIRFPRTMFLAVALFTLTGCGHFGSHPDSTQATAEIRYSQPSQPQQIGAGFLNGVSPDGSAAYVEEESKDFPQPGCEGQPEPVMYRLPVVGGDEKRELVRDTEDNPVRGQVIRGTGSRIAVVDACEGFFSALWVGAETADGHLADLKPVTLRRNDNQPLPAPYSFSWSTDGEHLLAAVNDPTASRAGSVVRINPATEVITRLFDSGIASGVSQVGQLDDGSYVIAGNRKVTLRDAQGAITATFDGNGFALAPDRKRIAAFDQKLLLITPGQATPVTVVPAKRDHQITSANFSPNGRAISYGHNRDGADTEVAVVTVADRTITPITEPGPFGPSYFSGDGKALAFNRFDSEPAFVATVMLVRFGSGSQ